MYLSDENLHHVLHPALWATVWAVPVWLVVRAAFGFWGKSFSEDARKGLPGAARFVAMVVWGAVFFRLYR